MLNQANTAYAGIAKAMVEPVPEKPTRFSQCADSLQARVTHLFSLIDRCSRVADRLGGPVPEAAETGNNIKNSGNCVASVIERSVDDLDSLICRAERAVERLEQL